MGKDAEKKDDDKKKPSDAAAAAALATEAAAEALKKELARKNDPVRRLRGNVAMLERGTAARDQRVLLRVLRRTTLVRLRLPATEIRAAVAKYNDKLDDFDLLGC